MDPVATQHLQKAFERATGEFNLCPNRVWSVAGGDLPKLMPDCNLIITQARSKKHDNDESEGVDQGRSAESGDHELCTYDFCEHSQRDFTAVEQRHECENPSNCLLLSGLFSRRTLTKAAEDGKITVWSLDGRSMIDPSRPYMAISHVWSDGTGNGAWQEGEVNECLYNFFRRIAEQFQCEGIWWDTVCIPRKKAARHKAIQKIQQNYENARITLVHDLFLRNCEWNEKTACFAILMSPWFSRGWTALELAKSQKVKVIFKGSHGLLIKDLDQQILKKKGEDDPRKSASQIIMKLRERVTTLDDLLVAIGPRYTSWAEDRSRISGLLVDSALLRKSQKGNRQQGIYRGILAKIGKVSPGHLFHSSATMPGVSWCPTNLFDMPVTTSESSLCVTKALDLIGRWRRIPVTDIQATGVKYCWRGTNSLVKEKLQFHLEDQESGRCFFLFECQSATGDKPDTGLVERALLVKEKAPQASYYQYIGAVYFHSGLKETYLSENAEEMEVTLLGDPERKEEYSGNTSERKKPENDQTYSNSQVYESHIQNAGDPATQGAELLNAIWRGDHERFSKYVKTADLCVSDGSGQQPLHLAADRGDEWVVSELLESAREKGMTKSICAAKCAMQQTALHRAAWGGSVAVVELLLAEIDSNIQDRDGNSALHIAAEKGFEAVAKRLIDAKGNCRLENRNNMSPLHCAIGSRSGQLELVQLFLDNGAQINAKEMYGRTPLHYAAETGQLEIIHLLLDKGADVNAGDKYGWTPLHYAAEGGQQEAVELLLGVGVTDVNAKDAKVGWTPLHFAAINGHLGLVKRLTDLAGVGGPDNFGWTPWRFAALKKHRAVAGLLSEESASVGFNVLDKSCWTLLHFAAINERQGLIKLCLNKDMDVDIAIGHCDTLLSRASRNGQVVVVRLLLDEGAEVELRDSHGHSPLWGAAENGHESVVRLLQERGANSDFGDPGGTTILSVAARNGHKGIVQLLLNKGADVDARRGYRGSTRDTSPLWLAVENGHESVVQLLLDRGAEVESRGKDLLWQAFRNGHESVVQLFLDRGVDVESKNHDSLTLLFEAVTKRDEGMIQLLLDGGADIESKDQNNRTPLVIAAKEGLKDMIQLLLERGADIESKKYRGGTPLLAAADGGHTDAMQLLLDRGADIESKDYDGRTPFRIATDREHMDAMQLLLDRGADIESKDQRGETPLLASAGRRRMDVIQLLLDRGADIESRDQEGAAPLSVAAARWGRMDVVQLLLDRGADIESRDRRGTTPLLAAARCGDTNAMQLLLDRDADIVWKNQEGTTPLLAAAKYGTRDPIQLLLDRGADIESRDSRGTTPLLAAAENGTEDSIQLLLDRGADINSKDNSGKTPLQKAGARWNKDIIKLLQERGAEGAYFEISGQSLPSFGARKLLELAGSVLDLF